MTPRQREAYDFICAYWDEKGCGPSYAQIMDALDIRSKSGVHRIVKSLVEIGAVVQKGRKARSLRPANMPWPPKGNVVRIDFKREGASDDPA